MGLIENTTLYPYKANPALDDYVIGTDSENSGETVSFKISDLQQQISGTIYTGSGTIGEARTVTFENTLLFQGSTGASVLTFQVQTGPAIQLTSSAALLYSDSGSFAGFAYKSDYSANYGARSLVDKEYVDNRSFSPAGADTNVQYNNAGAVAGSSVVVITDSGTKLGVGASSVDASAIMQIDSTTLGVLIPRMTTVQRDAIASPATGLMIYNTTTLNIEMYNGSAWGGPTTAGIDTVLSLAQALTANRSIDKNGNDLSIVGEGNFTGSYVSGTITNQVFAGSTGAVISSVDTGGPTLASVSALPTGQLLLNASLTYNLGDGAGANVPAIDSDSGDPVLTARTSDGLIGRASANTYRTLSGAGAPVDGTTVAFYVYQQYYNTTDGTLYVATSKSTNPDSSGAGSVWTQKPGQIPAGTIGNSVLRWNGAAYVETNALTVSPTLVTANQILAMGKSVRYPYRNESTAYLATTDDHLILCTGSFALTFPSAVGLGGTVWVVKNEGVGTITLTPDGAETIDGSATFNLTSGQSVNVWSDNVNLVIT